tara:strand:- start:632 stop:838 length:207 start_codon:yes stop_codon:yes gene_type:complete
MPINYRSKSRWGRARCCNPYSCEGGGPCPPGTTCDKRGSNCRCVKVGPRRKYRADFEDDIMIEDGGLR